MIYFLMFYAVYVVVYVIGGVIVQASIAPSRGMSGSDYLIAERKTETFRVWWWCLGLLLLFTLPTVAVILRMFNIF